MSLSVGIVGLPNVGKSTLFNAMLKKQQALAANYPFATIEPNIGIVPVADERLNRLAEVVAGSRRDPLAALKTESTFSVRTGGQAREPVGVSPDTGKESLDYDHLPPVVPATVKFVDSAGLVRGAHKGEGLGNQFLAHIREVNLMCLVIRAFRDPEVVETGSGDVRQDLQILKMELMMKDAETLSGQMTKPKSKNLKQEVVIDRILKGFDEGKMAIETLTDEELEEVGDLFLLTVKPYVVVVNVGEKELGLTITALRERYTQQLGLSTGQVVVISAKLEAELADLSLQEQRAYLHELGLELSGLDILVKTAYKRLDLISFLTAGEKEVRAWTITRGDTAVVAAGVIHSDFVTHFIKADVIAFEKFVEAGGWKRARELGWVRSEGREYVMTEGEVVEFKVGR